MKNRLSKVFFLLVCAAILCAALSVALAEDTGCSHQYATVTRPHDNFEATCKEGAGYYVTVTCSNCGGLINEYKEYTSSADPNAHKFKTTTLTGTGECASGTTEQKICTLCGYTTENTSNASHNWESKSHTASDCSDDSYTYEECSKCHLQRNYQTTTKTTIHTFTKTKPTVTREATCSTAGEQTQKCDCGQTTKVIPISKTAHNYGDSITTPGSCTVKEETYALCQTCGDKKVIKTGSYVHNYVATTIKDATCITTGTRESRCSKCNALEWSMPIPALGHSITWQLKDGSTHQAVCSRCSAITATGSHTPNKQNPLCTDRVYCTVCFGDLRAAGKHATSVVTDNGDDTYHDLACPTCGYVTSRVKHTYSYVGSNCTNNKVCSVCSHTVSGNSSHSLSSTWTGISGGHARKCTVSGCSYMVSEAHTWGDWSVAYPPTTTSTGTEAARCTKCSAIMTRAIPKLTATDAPQATNAPSVSGSTDSQTNPPTSSGSADEPTNPPASSGSTNTQPSAPTASGTASSSQSSAPATSGSTSAPAASVTQSNATVSGSVNNQTSAPAAETVSSTGTPADTQTADNATVTAEHADSVATPVSHSTHLTCADLGRECTWEEFLQGGLLVRVCTICGNVSAFPLFSDATTVAPVFQTITGVVVNGATPATGALILRAASLTDANGVSSDAYLAISAVWEKEGSSVQLQDTVQVCVPLTIGEASDDATLTAPTADFRLVRVDVSNDDARLEEWTDIDFTYEDGILSFDMEQTGIYLLIPA